MSRRPVANPLALAVLSCLWERPMYPYEMTTSLRQRGKEDSIRLNFGSLYTVIKSLEKHELIVPTRTEREGKRPERIVYAITDAGRKEAVSWLRELVAIPVKEYPAFETALALLPMLPPADAIMLLHERLVLLATDLSARARLRESPAFLRLPELFLIEFDYRVAMLRAERAFVAAMVERLENRALGGIALWDRMHELVAIGRSPAEIEPDLVTYMAQPGLLSSRPASE